MSSSPHPARSLDFLSRLHDGELSPAERAHFESHRAHCAECRKAAAEFEDALAVYRTAGTQPPSSDLAARILRRLETSSRRRSPFGVVFGIDLRWAGAFMAALIAVIFGSLVLDRRETSSQRIPISFALPTPGAPASLPSSLPPAEPQDKALPNRPEAKEPKDNVAAPLESPAAADERLIGTAPPAAQRDALDSAPKASEARTEVTDARRSRALARAKGEDPSPGGAGETFYEGSAPSRILVAALDGQGAAPDAINAAELTFRHEDYGRYVFVIGANGIPIEVGLFAEASREKRTDLTRSASEALRKLRFQPGAQPRRLLVSIESGS